MTSLKDVIAFSIGRNILMVFICMSCSLILKRKTLANMTNMTADFINISLFSTLYHHIMIVQWPLVTNNLIEVVIARYVIPHLNLLYSPYDPQKRAIIIYFIFTFFLVISSLLSFHLVLSFNNFLFNITQTILTVKKLN